MRFSDLQMVFIQTGLLLSNLFENRKVQKHPYLLQSKKLFVKMSSVLLGSCKLDLPLSKIQLFCGIK
ncbi:unnamed protein product [Brassica oleracea]